MKWVLLAVGIAAELLATTSMKLSEGFTKPLPSVLAFVFWATGIAVVIFILKRFDLSLIYAIWAGLGIAGASFIGIVFFKEPYNAVKIISLAIIILGVIILNVNDLTLNK